MQGEAPSGRTSSDCLVGQAEKLVGMVGKGGQHRQVPISERLICSFYFLFSTVKAEVLIPTLPQLHGVAEKEVCEHDTL